MKKSDAIAPSIPAPIAVKMVRETSSSAWMKMGKKNALKLFRQVAKRVPAYKDFLKEQKINASSVKTWNDFKKIPSVSKATYLKKYTLAEVCWDGSLARPAVFSSTSGSTGKPFHFQRSQNLEDEYSAIIDLFLSNGKYPPSSKYPTLVIVGFGMGVWIGGMLTYRAYEIASNRGYPLSILPTGVNKNEILSALRDLAPQFKQTILIGYPPFIKDILDEAEDEGINLKGLNLRLQFAAESFTEQFRDYLAEKAGLNNVFRDTFNIYGTADIGAMAFETPTAILIRRLAITNPNVFGRLFGTTKKMPTLAQYNPSYIAFETNESGEILLTGNSAVPLVRYAIGDHGGVHSFDEIKTIFKEGGIDLIKEAKKHDVPLYELPFVYVYERSDLATTLYGLQIYPQYIKDALLEKSVQKLLTGKFQMETKFDEDQNQYLDIILEKKKRTKELPPEFVTTLTETITKALKEKSSEYRELSAHVQSRPLFSLEFKENGDPEHFPSGIKQKWVKK